MNINMQEKIQKLNKQKNFVMSFSRVIDLINLKIAAKMLKVRENIPNKLMESHFPNEVMMLLQQYQKYHPIKRVKSKNILLKQNSSKGLGIQGLNKTPSIPETEDNEQNIENSEDGTSDDEEQDSFAKKQEDEIKSL